MSTLPPELKFTKTHEWLKTQNDEVVIGITAHAQELLGDLVFVDLPEVGRTISSGEEVAVVESVKAASDVYAPVSGTVCAVNQQVCENPALVNQDPYGNGWLIKIRPNNLSDLEILLSTEQYQQVISEDH